MRILGSNTVSNNNKKSDTDNDPPIKPLSEEEQADLPALLATSESPAFSSMMDLSSLGRALGVTVVEVNKCIACNQKKSRDEFFYNQWIKDDTYGPRCRSCVKRGEFRVVNQEQFWAGWPKDPLQVMWERGWIDCPRGQRPDPDARSAGTHRQTGGRNARFQIVVGVASELSRSVRVTVVL